MLSPVYAIYSREHSFSHVRQNEQNEYATVIYERLNHLSNQYFLYGLPIRSEAFMIRYRSVRHIIAIYSFSFVVLSVRKMNFLSNK